MGRWRSETTERRGRRVLTVAAVAVAVVSLGACSQLGAVVVGGGGPVGGGGHYGTVLEGEVRQVDARRGRLQVRDHRHRTHTVQFDNRTQVVYRQRQYRVSALERGDVVRVRVVRDRYGSYWADRVDVRRSVRERGVAGAQVERLDGFVSRVDARRGWFMVEPRRGSAVVVHLPRVLTASDQRRLQRLRPGDRVSVEVVPVGRGVAELYRFR